MPYFFSSFFGGGAYGRGQYTPTNGGVTIPMVIVSFRSRRSASCSSNSETSSADYTDLDRAILPALYEIHAHFLRSSSFSARAIPRSIMAVLDGAYGEASQALSSRAFNSASILMLIATFMRYLYSSVLTLSRGESKLAVTIEGMGRWAGARPTAGALGAANTATQHEMRSNADGFRQHKVTH